jgi:L-rhamnose mutarotase
MVVKRVASVVRLRPECEEPYRSLHQKVWPDVQRTLRENGVSNYSIFLLDGTLFSYLEYEGEDYDEATARIAGDPITQAWWELTNPCQVPVESAALDEWWAPAEEIFHLDA